MQIARRKQKTRQGFQSKIPALFFCMKSLHTQHTYKAFSETPFGEILSAEEKILPPFQSSETAFGFRCYLQRLRKCLPLQMRMFNRYCHEHKG